MPKTTPRKPDEGADWPASNVQMMPVDTLVAYAKNSRRHSAEQVSQIAASITEFGWTTPVLAAPDGTIIAGHGRVLAAQQLGLKRIPVMVAEGWSEEQRRAYTIADNKLTELGEWDEAMLKMELSDLRDEGFDVGLIGFSSSELDKMLEASVAEAPDQFAEFGEDIETEHKCPKCGYAWSGKAS